jgi:hypothetical protein
MAKEANGLIDFTHERRCKVDERGVDTQNYITQLRFLSFCECLNDDRPNLVVVIDYLGSATACPCHVLDKFFATVRPNSDSENRAVTSLSRLFGTIEKI